MNPADQEEVRIAAEAAARRSYGKLVGISRGLLEDGLPRGRRALGGVRLGALSTWRDGCPANPEAWLLTVARRQADRSGRGAGRPVPSTTRTLSGSARFRPRISNSTRFPTAGFYLFACAHPAIEAAIHAPLILQVVLGLDAGDHACSTSTSPATMGKRLVRAAELHPRPRGASTGTPAAVSTTMPRSPTARAGPTGTDVTRRDLTEEAVFLARLVAELMPDEPEAGAAGARAPCRSLPAGASQCRWRICACGSGSPQPMGLANDLRSRSGAAARKPAGTAGPPSAGSSAARLHAERCRSGRSNWAEIVALYDGLLAFPARRSWPSTAGSGRAALRGGTAFETDVLAGDAPTWNWVVGRARRSCWHAPVQPPKHITPTTLRSAWSAMPPSAALFERRRAELPAQPSAQPSN